MMRTEKNGERKGRKTAYTSESSFGSSAGFGVGFGGLWAWNIFMAGLAFDDENVSKMAPRGILSGPLDILSGVIFEARGNSCVKHFVFCFCFFG